MTSKYSYIKDPHGLPINKAAVFRSFKANGRRLRKNPDRAALYESQIGHD